MSVLIIFYLRQNANVVVLNFTLDPPNVQAREPTEVIVNQTQIASFSCEAFGIPVPSVSWIRDSNGFSLSNTTNIITITTSILPPTSLVSTLTFLNAANSNESSYTCVGSNGVSNLIGTPENDTVDLLVQGGCTYVTARHQSYDNAKFFFHFKYLLGLLMVQ